MSSTVRAFLAACQYVSRMVEGNGLRINFYIIRQAAYPRLPWLPSEMRNNVAKIVTASWKSWLATGRVGHPPTFERPIVQYSEGRDWSLPSPRVVSLRTLARRIRVGFTTGPRDALRLAMGAASGELGAAVLVRERRGWFLKISVELPNPPTWTPETPIGVDRGIDRIAVARALGASPLVCSASALKHARARYARTRTRLQLRGTPSAMRVLRRLRGRERRLVLDACRKAAHATVEYALGFRCPVLVLEDLNGIQGRCVRKSRRNTRHRLDISTWAYDSFLSCLELAAEANGLPLDFVTPSWSSKTCPRCGDARDANRRGASFRCHYCNYRNHADVVGATNLARRWLHEHARQPWGPVSGPNERGYDEWAMATPPDAQAIETSGGADTPLPT